MNENIRIIDGGKDNKVEVKQIIKNKLNIHMAGNKNTIIIGKISIRQALNINIVGDDAEVVIDDGCLLNGSIDISGGGRVYIGAEVTAQNLAIISQEAKSIRIGRRCMFGRNVTVRNSDAHSIFDIETGKRINRAKDTIIDEHVWMAHGAVVMKGTHLRIHTIVGVSSTVTGGSYPPSVILAGVPAKIVRTGVIWDRWFGEDVHDPALSDYLAEYLTQQVPQSDDE